MTWRDVVREAYDSLSVHRLRATLAALGVLTGVAAVVTASAISAGAERQAMADIATLGIDNLIVHAASDRDRGEAPRLQEEDATAVARAFPRATVAWMRTIADAIEAPSGNDSITVAGVSASWRTTCNLQVAAGRWVGDGERGPVAVIDASLAHRLFPAASSVGKRVLAGGEWRTIVGVLGAGPSAANASVQALNLPRTVFVPFEALDVSLGAGDDGTAIEQMVVKLPAGSDHAAAARALRHTLEQRHDRAAFEIVVPRELLRAKLRAQRTFDAVMYAAGALALIVSGIGIANIMVASVSERAAEIGVRRAVGAPRVAILAQFAAEALLMACAGGAAGLIAGAVAAAAIAALASWPIAVTPGSIVAAVALAIAVGLASGTYPARLAAAITPIDALRQ